MGNVKHFDILEDLYLQYEDMQKAMEKYCTMFDYEITEKASKFYELKTKSNGIVKHSYFTDKNLPQKEKETYKNNEYTEMFVSFNEIS